MNKHIPWLVCLLILPASLQAQVKDCNDGRYTDHVFTEVRVVKDLSYGEALTMGGKSQTLLLDFYEPVGDLLEERPLVVMAHGGAFVGGDRTQTEEFCFDFAKRGYAIANIAYRLLDTLVFDSLGITETAFMAANDMRAAVRFFREDASQDNVYGISSDQIFVAGVSAGGIMASHVGFLDSLDQVPEYIQLILDKHGGHEGNSSENTQYSSEVAGVLNYSGALTRSHWIDEKDPPLYSAHDDGDPTVPCTYDRTALLPFPVYLYGSCAMKTVADQMGVKNELYLVSNSSEHVSYFKNEDATRTVLNESAEFLSSIICEGATAIPEANFIQASDVLLYPNPFKDILNIQTKVRIRELTVTSLTGQTYLSLNEFNGQSLELGDLPQGLYLVHIKSDKGSVTRKAVKE